MKRLLILLLLIPVVSADYEIVGDSVQIDDANIYFSITPHTLTQSGYQEITLISKKYGGNIDIAFGFNSEDATPKSLDLNAGVGWINIADSFNKVNFNFQSYDTWYIAKNINVNTGQEYTTRMYLNILPNPFGSSGKYFVAIKPSSETIQQAITNGHFYYIDPWWQSPGYIYRYLINSNSTSNLIPSSVNDTGCVNGTCMYSRVQTPLISAYVYSQSAGPSGVMSIATNTSARSWENTTAPGVGGVNPTLIYSTNVTGWWHFDDGTDANDSSQFDNDGTNSGATSTIGQIGTALNFSLNDFVNVTDDDSLEIGTGNFTVCAWINTSVAGHYTIAQKQNIDTSVGWNFGMRTGGRLYTIIHNGTGGVTSVNDGTVLSNGDNHFVCVVFDRSLNMTRYVNGTIDGTPSNIINITGDVSNTLDLYIGARRGVDRFWSGLIDEVSIFNRTLNSIEIQEIYWNGINNLTSLGVEEINQAPSTPTLNSPIDGYSTTDDIVTLNATATDPDGDTLTYYFYNASQLLGTNTTGIFTWDVSTLQNGTQTWYMNVSDGLNDNVTSTTRTLNILLDPDTCPSGTANELQIYTFNLTDEETFNNLTGFTGAVLIITHAGTDYTFSVSNSSTDSLEICVDGVYENDEVDIDLTFHNGAIWPLGSWYIRDYIINATTTTQIISLLNTTHATLSNIYVIDANGNQAEDYFVTLLQYNYTDSVWQVLRMGQTDSNGLAPLYLRRDDRFYSFYVYDENMNYLQTFSNYIITSLETTLRINLSAESILPDALANIASACFSTNASVYCTAEDTGDPVRMVEVDLRVWEGGAINWTIVCTNDSTSNPANISCTGLDATEIHWYIFRADVGAPKILETGAMGNASQTDYAEIGVFTAGFLSLSLGLVGAYSPPMFVLLLSTGFIMSNILGLISYEDSMTISLFATGALLVMWRLKNK